jgi:ribonuclease-3
MTEERHAKILEFLRKLGLEPDPSELHLFEAALTHSSYAFEKQLTYDNERLEFLGDAVIGLLTAEDVFRTFEKASEGELSKRRGRIVSRNNLGRLAREMGIAEVVSLGRGEERSGGRQRPVLLGSVLEALVGAIYVALGWETSAVFVRRHILQSLEDTPILDIGSDHKSALQEYVQRRRQSVPVYRLARQIGPDHDKRFLIEVFVRGEKWGEGWGSRKKKAENEAARAALEKLGYNPEDDFAQSEPDVE